MIVNHLSFTCNLIISLPDKLHRRLSQVTLLVGYLNSTLYNVSEGECYTELKEGASRGACEWETVGIHAVILPHVYMHAVVLTCLYH